MRRLLLTAGLAAALAGCSGEAAPTTRGVYLLMDTSGTYTEELDNAQAIINAILAKLEPGDSFAVARVDTGSFSEKDIVARVTFDERPSVTSALTFPASVLGIRVTLTGCGFVHSVFARTLNLSGRGTWFALQSPEVPAVAHGVQVLWPLRDLREHFAEGAAWEWHDGRLSIARSDGGRIRVNARQATMWRSPLRPSSSFARSSAG